jgi:hypothetical protein
VTQGGPSAFPEGGGPVFREGGGPVFIVGAPRSGTSILYRTLLKHQSFAVDGEEALQLAESAILDSLPSAPRWKIPRPPRLWLYFLRDEVGYGSFLAEVDAITAGREPTPPNVKPPWTAPVLEAFVRHGRETRSCRRLLEKTPTHIERADWLLESLPDARLIFIHRHPLDTYTSYLRRAQVDPNARWAALSVEQFGAVYRSHAHLATEFAARDPSRFLIVSYEAFTSDPATQTEEVCAFVGERFDPSLVEEPSPDLTRSANDPHLFGPITDTTKDWSDFVDVDTARRVEDETRPATDLWGYPRRLSD